MLDTIYSQIGAAVIVLVCGFALWKGGRAEQWAGGILIVAWLGTILIQDQTDSVGFHPLDLVVDASVLAALGTIAWRSDRNWPIWASACQAINLATHLAFALDLRIPETAYYSALALASYGVLVALAVGTFLAWRESEALKPPAARL